MGFCCSRPKNSKECKKAVRIAARQGVYYSVAHHRCGLCLQTFVCRKVEEKCNCVKILITCECCGDDLSFEEFYCSEGCRELDLAQDIDTSK